MDLKNKIENILTTDIVNELEALLKNKEYHRVVSLVGDLGCNMSDLFIKLWDIRIHPELSYQMKPVRIADYTQYSYFSISINTHTCQEWRVQIPKKDPLRCLPDVSCYDSSLKIKAFCHFGNSFENHFKSNK